MPESAGQRVLIVNDDGIDAPGIILLEEIVRGFTDDIWVVAPDEERSGAGHSLSLSYPIRIKQRDERHFSVKGTPTDCALLAIHDLMGGAKPDILLSGINRGPNLAEDVTYSGTASAAMEGAMLGVPAVALSLIWKYQAPIHWETARAYAAPVLERLLAMDWRQGTFVNVNFPHCPPHEVSGIRVTVQGMRPPGAFMPVRRTDERYVPYYWIKIAHPEGGESDTNDLGAARDKAVSITPMQLDMTAHDLLPGFADAFAGTAPAQ